jgi:hypothetical protein
MPSRFLRQDPRAWLDMLRRSTGELRPRDGMEGPTVPPPEGLMPQTPEFDAGAWSVRGRYGRNMERNWRIRGAESCRRGQDFVQGIRDGRYAPTRVLWRSEETKNGSGSRAAAFAS